jgi:hypothetical protein
LELAAFALVWRPSITQTSVDLPEPLREDAIDNRYRRMIEEALEAVLYCTLPAHCPPGTEVSVDCATRQREPEPPYDSRRLTSDFGIGINQRNGDYYVLTPDSVYPIVGRLLSARHGHPPNVRRARGTTLYDLEHIKKLAGQHAKERSAVDRSPSRKERTAYERIVNDQSRPRPQQIHYLADWFARFGMHAPSLPSAKIVHGAFKNGFLESRDERFDGWLRAARAGAEGRVTDALLEVWMASKHKDPTWSVSRWLRQRASDWVEMLDGHGFIELAERIDAMSGRREPIDKQST